MKIKRSITLVLCLLLSACGHQAIKETDIARQKGLLLVGIGPDPEGLDPQCVSGVTEQNVLRSLFEGLVRPDPKTSEPRPGVAISWTVSENGLTYRFFLRQDARWSNGDPLTTHDFVFSFQRLLTQEIGSPSAHSFFFIKNARQFYNKELPFEQVGVKAVNDYELDIELEQPTPFFLSLLMMPAAYPLHRPTLKACNGEFIRDPLWTQPQNFVSNGAFKLKNWRAGKNIEVTKNEYYWDQEHVALSGIKFLPISDVATEERAFRSGQLHITENVPYTKIKAYHEQASSPLRIHPYFGTFYYVFNTKVQPLNNVRVRKALNLALHREELMGCDLFQIKHKSTFQLVPEGCQNFHCINPIREDAEEARRLLAEAGYPNGQGFPKLTLIFNTAQGQTYLASAMQEMWKKELNIDIELINVEWKVYLQRRREKDFEIARGGWIGDYNDPTTFLNLWIENNPNNFTYWHNTKFEKYLRKASKEIDSQRRIHYLGKAESLLLEECPLLPIHASATSHLVDGKVCGWYPNLLDWHPYENISFSEE